MAIGLQASGVRHAICEDFRLEGDLEGPGQAPFLAKWQEMHMSGCERLM